MRLRLFFLICFYSAEPTLAHGALIFNATLFGSGGVPSKAGVIGNTGSSAFGFIQVNFDTPTNSLTIIAPASNFCCLPSNSTGITFTAPATPNDTGATQFTLAGVPNTNSGVIPKQTFILSPFQAGELQAGQFYAVLQTTQFPLGELGGPFIAAGQVVDLVPEPSTFVLFGIALALIAGRTAHRAKKSCWSGEATRVPKV